MLFKTISVAILCLPGLMMGHPGHDLIEELTRRQAFLGSARQTSLSHCAKKLNDRGVQAQNRRRRYEMLEKTRLLTRASTKNSTSSLIQSHNKTSLGYDQETSATALFSDNSSCVLTPEVTEGPYYVGGELVRHDISETQPGVKLLIDYQIIDVDTCDPVPNVFVEIWHCNATGVYSGVVANGNGDSSDRANVNSTFLRGIQKTDSVGIVQFTTIFPGHYSGRTTHAHVIVHTNVSENANGTLGQDTYASHVGQSFFDQDLLAAINQAAPYSYNVQKQTLNSEDSILAEEADGTDPLLSYVMLGDTIEDGLLAWSAVGINTSYSNLLRAASSYYASGGVSKNNSGIRGGPDGSGPPGGNGGNATDGRPQGTGTFGATVSPTSVTSVADKFTLTAVAISFVGLLLPVLWL